MLLVFYLDIIKLMSQNILDNLNSEQKKAVKHQEGPLLIVAGAGTGKTTVITKRIAHIIRSEWAKPEEILALTFTEKAAQEMEDRVIEALTYGYFDLWISTFHSFAERILRQEGLAIGLPTDFKLLNEFEQYILFKKNLDRFELDYYKPLGNPTKFIKTLLSHFSRAKDEDISPAQYLEYSEELEQNLDNMLSGSKGKKTSRNFQFPISNFQDQDGEFNKEIAEQEVCRIKEIAHAYHTYEQLLLENSYLDFGDLINYCLKLFRERPAVLEKYRAQFKYILLDEFQDTNWAQYELIKLLATPKNNLVMVGDDDQCLPADSLIRVKDGTKRIDKIKKGEEVASAVGRGYLSHYKVSKVKKEKKKANFLTFTTREGNKIKVTDNHKMFCFVPNSLYSHSDYNDDYDVYYYVYLMHKEGLGWRIGITNDPAVRLRMERSADKMVVMQAFTGEQEARFYENLYSLKYGIPTVCFAERDGVMTKRKWSERLYKELNVEKGVKQFAHDLGVDLNYHQVGLDAVNRGGKVRIKIVIENCMRNYRSKYAKGAYLESPALNHQLILETSHRDTLKKLEDLGYSLVKAKKGKKLCITSKNLDYLGRVAGKIKKHTGGIIENRIKVAKNNVAHKKALVIPAGNVLEGMFLPVVKEDDIYYEQVKKIDSRVETRNVYDLEVEHAHNFVANNVVVHNSIFRFRGASMSNILQFKKDYPDAKQIFLVNNYRNGQNILNTSYDFIKQNDPNRLEYQLNKENKKFNKKLVSQTKEKGKIEILSPDSQEKENKEIVKKIIELKEKDKKASWDDFAVLVRTNQGAEEVCEHLAEAGLPYIFYSSKGLYNKPEIMDAIAYLKLITGYQDNVSFFRVLSLPIFKFSPRELSEFNYWADRKSWTLFEVLHNASALGLSAETQKKIQKVLPLIEKHAGQAREKNASEIFLNFLNDSGLLKYYLREENYNQEIAVWLQEFLQRIKRFEADSVDKKVDVFLEELQMEIDAGESGNIPLDLDIGPEAIKVMTVHAAKGLEFKYIFIAQLVDKRFPTIEKKELLPLPEALIKESLPEGDIHLEEERRLFYVALTRGKSKVYLSWARDCGGKTLKKPSQFLVETGFVKDPVGQSRKSSQKEKKALTDLEKTENKKSFSQSEDKLPIPSGFSYTQISAFLNCPYQYRFAHILRVPSRGKASFSFGKTLHNTLQKTFELINTRRNLSQGDLFAGAEEKKEEGKLISYEEILDFYKKSWEDDWYENKAQKKESWDKGRKVLKDFYQKHKDNWPRAILLEKSFNFKIEVDGEYYPIKGAMDRVDEEEGKIKIIDYKTGQMPKGGKLDFNKKLQLLIYQLATRDLFSQEIKSLSFYYLEANQEIEVLGSEKDLDKAREKIVETIRGIKKGEYPPRPTPLCKYCDYKDICDYRKL